MNSKDADEGTRTPDLRITSALLYQLSYISKQPSSKATFIIIRMENLLSIATNSL